MNLSKLEELQTRLVRQDDMVTKLQLLRKTARRVNPKWENCINVSFAEGDPILWDVALNCLAGKLVHDNKSALEMAICNIDGHDIVIIRTA